MAHITVGFQALLALQLVMMFFEAGHPDTQVREHVDQLIPNQRRSLDGQRGIRPQELMFSLHMWGCSFHICGEIPDPRRQSDQWRK